jgi:hypothetical protein
MPRRENERGLTLAIDYATATLRSLLDGKEATDVVVVDSARWAREELDEFISRNTTTDPTKAESLPEEGGLVTHQTRT